MHQEVGESNEKWTRRIECSYIPVDMLQNILPPKTPRPYIGEGIFYAVAPYGNEWLINNYLLYKNGIALLGPDFKTIVKPIDIVDVQKACIRDLFKEWEPKINDSAWLKNSHYQSYVVVNLCRILYTVLQKEVTSKRVAAVWVKNELSPEWKELIQTAESWEYGKDMHMQEETKRFIKFVINKVRKSSLST